MEIRKDLPFNHCDNCSQFVVDVDEQIVFNDNKPSVRVLTVGCKNEWLCKQLKEEIAKENTDG